MTTQTAADTQASVDVRGRIISTFVIYEALGRLREMAHGQVLEIVTEPFSPIDSDVAAWCRMTGHELVETALEPDRHLFRVRKVSAPRRPPQTFALVLSSPGLEEMLSPLGFALAAALTGDRVHIYFQGSAVRVLKRGFREKLRGISRPFSGVARRGLARAGHIPPQEKIAQLRAVDARFYACGPSMQHFGVSPGELIFDDVTVCEYLTFLEVMRAADTAIMLQ